jgi:hypothetical protein
MVLDIAHNNIKGLFPLLPSNLEHLDISHNGTVDCGFFFYVVRIENFETCFVDDNIAFTGDMPLIEVPLKWLSIGGNDFSGQLLFGPGAGDDVKW